MFQRGQGREPARPRCGPAVPAGETRGPACRRSFVPGFKLCGDLVYVVLFPQLLMVVHFRDHVNTYGSFIAFCLGFIVRLLGGEPYIGVPAVIHYPFFDEATNTQNFPFRTVAMLVSLVSLIVFSAIAKVLFKNDILPPKYDVCRCFDENHTQWGEQDGLADDGSLQTNKSKEMSALSAAEANLYVPQEAKE